MFKKTKRDIFDPDIDCLIKKEEKHKVKIKDLDEEADAYEEEQNNFKTLGAIKWKR